MQWAWQINTVWFLIKQGQNHIPFGISFGGNDSDGQVTFVVNTDISVYVYSKAL